MIDLVGVAWAWSTLSKLLAYPNSSKFPLGQRGSIIKIGLYIYGSVRAIPTYRVYRLYDDIISSRGARFAHPLLHVIVIFWYLGTHKSRGYIVVYTTVHRKIDYELDYYPLSAAQ